MGKKCTGWSPTCLYSWERSAGCFGESDENADAVAFLARERAAWITGAALEVDGGTLRGS